MTRIACADQTIWSIVSNQRPRAARAMAVLVLVLVYVGTTAAEKHENVILHFNLKKGAYPMGGLTPDGQGNFYGTTTNGGLNGQYCGSYGCGVIFKLSLGAGGKWAETVIYKFKGGTDGLWCLGTMAFDAKGNLYGTTYAGGAHALGTVFELAPQSNGKWKETIVHDFAVSPDGNSPRSGVIVDTQGNLYGTTSAGGTYGGGTVFEMSPQSGGGWTESVLHSFGASNDGSSPYAGVVFDSKGNLFGATLDGTFATYGAVFELSPAGNGTWSESLIYIFTEGNQGADPRSSLAIDPSGNLYGTTEYGGPYFAGNVFELSPGQGGTWTETSIHDFGSNNDGAIPLAGLVFDSKGNLYGTTEGGGGGCNGPCGTVYKLKPQSGGAWKESILHAFQSADDGSEPWSALVFDQAGHLYGTTEYGGGMYGYGTVYEILP